MTIDAFDFDTPVDRTRSDSMKWGGGKGDDDVIPMWVADMDFATAPCVRRAVEKRAAHGVFGYVEVPERYYNAVRHWFATRHGWEIARDSIIVTSGVVPAVSAVIQGLARPGDKVLVQTPAYNCFFSSIRNSNCEVLANPLRYADGRWSIDFDDLRDKMAQAKLLLLCNPHNPSARCWSREELTEIAKLAKQAGVTVVSDEIHGEFVFGEHRYTPFATLSADVLPDFVVCTAASKAFNTAGLQNAVIVADDPVQRRAIERAINVNEVCDVNPFGVAATIAAYEEGAPWLAALLAYLTANDALVRETFAQQAPWCRVSDLQATYLEWVDCSALGMPSEAIEAELLAHERVRINAGSHYGETQGAFIRINIAAPRARLKEGLARITAGLNRLKARAAL